MNPVEKTGRVILGVGLMIVAVPLLVLLIVDYSIRMGWEKLKCRTF